MKRWFLRLISPRYIEVNCFLIDKKLLDMDIDQDGDPCRLMLNLSSIDSIRESMSDEGEMEERECVVYYRSGDSVVVNRSYNEMKLRLKKCGYL